MQKNFQKSSDEIHLFDILNLIWEGKGLILFFMIITSMLSYFFIISQNSEYESKLNYGTYLTPPFYEDERIRKDLQRSFFLRSSFIGWGKGKDDQDNISFEDLVGENLKIKFISNKYVSYISVSSSNEKHLNDLYDYANYINKTLTKEYASRAQLEMEMIKDLHKTYGTPSESVIGSVLDLDRFISEVEKGSLALSINYPSTPISTAPKPIIVILTSLFIGLVIGTIVVFIRNELEKYRTN